MRKLFTIAALALTLSAFAPQQTSAKENPGITVFNRFFHTEIKVVDGGYWWWLKDNDGNVILCGYTDTSGRTQSMIWS